ncbi:methyltransferase domain-containing protein [Winogradskyella rapida]|uniref:Methyltransferase domain-containing protein n=1 Tax=Winogradskyella rapida TaxID=549701 RepID=A0ABW3KP44_9FLAO
MEDKLTTEKYWESYYKHSHVNKKHITTVCSYYDRIWNVFIKDNDEKKSVIEIGGFPGRYLAYQYKLKPTCLDYNSYITQIEGSFKVMDVPKYHIVQEDFTKFKPQTSYDYVMSNGFIEHFENYDTILDLHVKYMSDQGRLLVMIPNMRGYIKFYKYMVDYKNLKVHNLKCMKLQVFENFAKRNNLSLLFLDYYGGFPLGVHQKNNLIQKLIYKGHRLFFKYFANEILEKHSSKYFSSAIVGIFEKKK